MPSIAYDAFVPWANYHLTTGTLNAPDLEPRVPVEDLGRFHAADLDGWPGIERFAATAAKLWDHVGRVWFLMDRKRQLNELGDPPMPFPAGLVGRGWSFSNLIGADRGKRRESLLMCEGLAGAIMLEAHDLAPTAQAQVGSIALAAGGTRFRELANWAAERYNKSIHTSGTHLGATVAGAIATATHGSRLGYGGMQNMIAGLHLITGLGESVWIERASEPVLTDNAAKKLNPSPETALQIIRDDAMFDDALVHLGCMGIVNCAAIRLVEDIAYEVLRRDRAVDAQWLHWVRDGDWQAIANWVGADVAGGRPPVFYEATINPHAWDGPSALHTFYFEAGMPLVQNRNPPLKSVGDATVRFGEMLSVRESAELEKAKLARLPDVEHAGLAETELERYFEGRRQPRPANMRVFDPQSQAQSAYDYYRITGGFKSDNPLSEPATWRQIHADEITGGYPGSLYNASYAIARGQVVEAIEGITKAVRTLPMSFVFTLRFVDKAKGTMRFTRFDENCVIEIDGLSPWICRRMRSRLVKGLPTYWKDKRMLDYLEGALPDGAKRMKRALNAKGIAFSNHFGKRSFIQKEKVAKDFAQQIARFRETRAKLLTSALGQAIFWNWGAVNFGIVERPKVLPLPFPVPPDAA